jgi:hypothetical protein
MLRAENLVFARVQLHTRIAFAAIVGAVKIFFHNSLQKRRAQTGIGQKRANQSQVIRLALFIDGRFLSRVSSLPRRFAALRDP